MCLVSMEGMNCELRHDGQRVRMCWRSGNVGAG